MRGLSKERSTTPKMSKALRTGYLFFFSSRRRHTRYIGDWSSDVYSSDLTGSDRFDEIRIEIWFSCQGKRCYVQSPQSQDQGREQADGSRPHYGGPARLPHAKTSLDLVEIGRASCRERGEIAVGGVAVREE